MLLEKNKEKSDSGRVNELEELVQQLQSQKTYVKMIVKVIDVLIH